MSHVEEAEKERVQIVLCSRKHNTQPKNCTLCVIPQNCDSMLEACSKVHAIKLGEKYNNLGHNVSLLNCNCNENPEDKDMSQGVTINTIPLLGGKNGSTNLWQQQRPYGQSEADFRRSG